MANRLQSVRTHILPACNFLSKGWEVGIIVLLIAMQSEYGFASFHIGMLAAVFIVSQVTISAFAGRIAHILHSRNVVLLAIGSSAVAWLILIFSRNLVLIYPALAFGGLSSGLFEPIGNSLVAKSSPTNRATAVGHFAACGDMGRIAVGAAAASLAGLIGLTPTFAILLGTTLLAFGLAEVLNRSLPDPTYAEKEEHIELGELLQNRKFRYATLAGIADSFSSASLYLFIPGLLTETKGIVDKHTGWYLGVFFCGYFAGRMGLGRLADRYGSAKLLMISKIAMSVLLVALIFVFGQWPIVALIFLLGIFTRGSSPIVRTMVADSVQDKSNFHNAFGTYSFASRGSSAFCRPIFFFVAGFAGWPVVFYILAGVSLATLYPALKYKKASAKPFPQLLSKTNAVLNVEPESQQSTAA